MAVHVQAHRRLVEQQGVRLAGHRRCHQHQPAVGGGNIQGVLLGPLFQAEDFQRLPVAGDLVDHAAVEEGLVQCGGRPAAAAGRDGALVVHQAKCGQHQGGLAAAIGPGDVGDLASRGVHRKRPQATDPDVPGRQHDPRRGDVLVTGVTTDLVVAGTGRKTWQVELRNRPLTQLAAGELELLGGSLRDRGRAAIVDGDLARIGVQHLGEMVDRGRIQPVQRTVENEGTGAGQQSLGDRHAASLPGGQPHRVLRRDVLQAPGLQGLIHAGTHLLPRHALLLHAEGQLLGHRGAQQRNVGGGVVTHPRGPGGLRGLPGVVREPIAPDKTGHWHGASSLQSTRWPRRWRRSTPSAGHAAPPG